MTLTYDTRSDHLYAEMYRSVKRKPSDGSLAEAIKVHAQACGFVAYAFDIHPDVVARAVAEVVPA